MHSLIHSKIAGVPRTCQAGTVLSGASKVLSSCSFQSRWEKDTQPRRRKYLRVMRTIKETKGGDSPERLGSLSGRKHYIKSEMVKSAKRSSRSNHLTQISWCQCEKARLSVAGPRSTMVTVTDHRQVMASSTRQGSRERSC